MVTVARAVGHHFGIFFRCIGDVVVPDEVQETMIWLERAILAGDDVPLGLSESE